MSKPCALLLGLLLALPTLVIADEVPPDEEMMEQAPVEETPAEEYAPEEATDEPATGEEYAEEEPTEGEAADDEPFYLYAGLDRADIEASFSAPDLQQQFGCTDCGTRFYRARVGTRVFDFIGLEAHYGFADETGEAPGAVEVDQYYGFFVVPTGTFFDRVEIAVPVGFSSLTLKRPGASHDFNRPAFGLNIEVPIIIMASWVPEIRIGGGGMVYQTENDARVYGFHFGFRLDFLL